MDAPVTKKLRVATTSLAGCFGCHMSFLDIDERLFELLELIEFDRSPLTDIKKIGDCDIGIIEGGLCNAENVHVLREFRARCRILVAIGACAINGGLPAQRNHLRLPLILAGGLSAPARARQRPDSERPGTAAAAQQGAPAARGGARSTTSSRVARRRPMPSGRCSPTCSAAARRRSGTG